MKKTISVIITLLVMIYVLMVSFAYAKSLSIDDQIWEPINEHLPDRTLVDKVEASGDRIEYSITDGNINDAFEINSDNGEITVANGSMLDYETLPTPKEYNLTIVIEDKRHQTATAIITIPINDIDETPILTNVVESLEVDAEADPQVIDPDVTLTCAGYPNFDDWSLEIAFANWDSDEDKLDIQASSGFTLTGSIISHDSTEIATIGISANGYILDFNVNADCQKIKKLIESFTYDNISDDPAPSREISLTVINDLGSSDPAIVSILVSVSNESPVGIDDRYEMYRGSTLQVSAADGVLANDENTGDSTTVVLEGSPPVQAGSFSLNSNGSFLYAHDGSATGTVSFTYKVCNDGNLHKCSTATVSIAVLETTVPVLSNPKAKNITKASVTLEATVDDDGGSSILERGIVWSTSADPTPQSCSGSKIKTGTLGEFSISVSGLSPNTTYHFRGYAENSNGCAYTADTTFTTDADYDFGDAPSQYPTKLAQDGARHALGSGLHLGSSVDAETDGQPSSKADGDGNDEDGVDIDASLSLRADTMVKVNVTASTSGKLNVWVDFNMDGDWDDSGEHIHSDIPLSGTLEVPIVAPSGVVSGKTYARFRISSQSGLGPTGPAIDGEVEDYQLILEGIDDGGSGGGALSGVSISSANINEGTELTLSGNVSDTGELEIDWGDGGNPQTSTITSSGNFTRQHKYLDAPASSVSYTIGIKFTDSSNAVHTDSKQVTVKNVKPTISLDSSPSSLNAGENCTLTLGEVTDKGQDIVTHYGIDWGDGSNPKSYDYVEGDTKSHIYTIAGVYVIHIELTDEDGTHPNAGTHSVTVNDPEAEGSNTNENSTNHSEATNDDGGDDTVSGGDTSRKTSSKRSSSSGVSGWGGSGLSSNSSSDTDDSGGGGIPIWLIVVPIIAVVVLGVGVYYFLGSYLEWW